MTQTTSVESKSRGFGLHYFATIVGVLALCTGILYVRAITTSGLFSGTESDSMVVSWTVAGMISIGSLGALIGLRWQRIGGLIALLAGLATAVATFILFTENKLLAMFIYGSPFIIAGGLFLADSWVRGRGKAANA